MSYFEQSFIKFFKDLSKNNNTEWFNTNRKVYEKSVKEPFAAFVDEMITRIRKHEPEIGIKPADAIMRINKDIRFSKDKTPYQTHVAANISKFGKKDKAYPGFYFQLSDKGITIYGGSYMVENDVLLRLRRLISEEHKAFASAYQQKSFIEKFGEIQGERSKRVPPEFVGLAEKVPLILNKQFYYTAELSADLITSPKLTEELMNYYQSGKKVNDFLRKAWGN